EVVGVVAGHPAAALLEGVDEEAEVEDVLLVGEDVVGEAALERKDVVEGDRAGRDHRHSVATLKKTLRVRPGPDRPAPGGVLVARDVSERASVRRVGPRGEPGFPPR